MFEDKELQNLLKADYISSTNLIKLIRKYKLARNPEKKEALRQSIYNNNIRFIRKMVSNKISLSDPDDVEDVFNSATIAFFEGLEKFKPNMGFKFSTYISYWIRKSIYDYYYGRNIIYIPKNSFSHKNKLESLEQAKKASNFSLLYLDELKQTTNYEDTYMAYDSIEDPTAINPEDVTIEKIYNEQLLGLVNKLNPNEQIVIKQRFLSETPQTLIEVGEKIGIRVERTRQIEYGALHKLRKMLNKIKQSENNHISQ